MPVVLPQGGTVTATTTGVKVQATSTQRNRTNTHHLRSVSVASTNMSSLAIHTDRQTHSQRTPTSFRKRPSYKLCLPSHPPTNHIGDPVHVFAQTDVDPWPLGAATADPPAHYSRQLVPVPNLAGQRTSRVSLHIKSDQPRAAWMPISPSYCTWQASAPPASFPAQIIEFFFILPA